MSFDVAAVRAQFPSLEAGAAHFDGPGGSQTPAAVARAVHDTLISDIANRGSVTAAEHHAEDIVATARAAMADLLGADAGGIVFGRSMTALTFEFARTLATDWTAGDEVVVSRLDHDANVRPWIIAAERAGATVRFADFDPTTGELAVDQVAAVVGKRTRLVALTGASNLIGTRPDLPAIAEIVHASGALFYVDGVHLTAHSPIDIATIGADFYACSPYKFFGPHCGVLAADPRLLETLHPDKLLPSSNAVPERFELGTLPFELLAGTRACVEFIADLTSTAGTRRERILASMSAASHHEAALQQRIEQGLTELDSVTLHSQARHRTPTLLITFANRSTQDAYRYLRAQPLKAPDPSICLLASTPVVAQMDLYVRAHASRATCLWHTITGRPYGIRGAAHSMGGQQGDGHHRKRFALGSVWWMSSLTGAAALLAVRCAFAGHAMRLAGRV